MTVGGKMTAMNLPFIDKQHHRCDIMVECYIEPGFSLVEAALLKISTAIIEKDSCLRRNDGTF
jgi:hypothetical protein